MQKNVKNFKTQRTPRPPRVRFQPGKDIKFDYKNTVLLQKFLMEGGKIFSRRTLGLDAKQQRHLAVAVKRARFLGLLPSGARN